MPRRVLISECLKMKQMKNSSLFETLKMTFYSRVKQKLRIAYFVSIALEGYKLFSF